MNQTKIKGGCQSGKKVVTLNSKCDLPLASIFSNIQIVLNKQYGVLKKNNGTVDLKNPYP